MNVLKASVITKLSVLVLAMLVGSAGSAFADKPSWAGGGGDKHGGHGNKEKHEKKHNQHGHKEKHKKHENYEDHDRYEIGRREHEYEREHHRSNEQVIPSVHRNPINSRSVYFTEQQRTAVHEYYSNEARAGRCPPGLAKKDNGCMPPGLAKKWAVGQPLPEEVTVEELPPEIVINLGTPPVDSRFVRVTTDILLINTATKVVIDAIENLYGTSP